MSELAERLREEFLKDKEYAHAYMEEFENSYIATQIKVLREQNSLTQDELAELAEMKQERISVLENVNYSSWSINTLRKLARAFDLVLHVSFENFGDEIKKITSFSREELSRIAREKDLGALPIKSNWKEITTYEFSPATSFSRNDQYIELLPIHSSFSPEWKTPQFATSEIP